MFTKFAKLCYIKSRTSYVTNQKVFCEGIQVFVKMTIDMYNVYVYICIMYTYMYNG